ncbi:MAG: shikimate kinase [Alphaproteobacteria bacterium]
MTDNTDPIPDRTIMLVGLMGAGKSAIGRRLAARLGRGFIDADHEVEKAAGCPIEDIFALHGEQAFRDGERRVMARLLSEAPCVLAAGGGAFMDPETRLLSHEKTISVWLRADLEVLLARVSRRDNRPLLKGSDKREVLENLMAERDPIYAQADIVVQTGNGPHDAVVDKVIEELGRLQRESSKEAERLATGSSR